MHIKRERRNLELLKLERDYMHVKDWIFLILKGY